MSHPLDGTQTPEAEDLAERIAIIMEDGTVSDEQAERLARFQQAISTQKGAAA